MKIPTPLEAYKKYYSEEFEKENFFRKKYSKLSKKRTSLEAVSHLMQIRNGLSNMLDLSEASVNQIKELNRLEKEEFRIEINNERIKGHKQEIEMLNIHYFAIDNVISDVIWNNYPKKLDQLTLEEFIESDKRKINHRPRDKSAPQDKIHNFVISILEKAKEGENGYKKFIHSRGDLKGLPNKNQIKKALIENDLVGEIADRTIDRRINTVLDDMS